LALSEEKSGMRNGNRDWWSDSMIEGKLGGLSFIASKAVDSSWKVSWKANSRFGLRRVWHLSLESVYHASRKVRERRIEALAGF